MKNFTTNQCISSEYDNIMAARAIWKGEICCGDFRLPVKLFSAVEDRSIHFHLLHDQDMVRIRQRMADPETDETIPRDQIRKGLEVSRNTFVVLDEKELDELEPPASRDIKIQQFVPHAAINHPWYDRPYWLGPDGDEDAYFAWVAALEKADVEGVARWVMRKKQYAGALRAEQGYLALIALRHAEDVVPAADLESPAGRALDERERDMAAQLLQALQKEFNPADYHDEYRQRVRELIETKREGGTVEVEEVEEKPTSSSLADSLRASLEAVS